MFVFVKDLLRLICGNAQQSGIFFEEKKELFMMG